MAEYDFRNTGVLGGILAAKADAKADIEFEQRRSLNALKLRQLTGQVEEWEGTKGYREKRRNLDLEKDKVWADQARLTTKRMQYELDDKKLDDFAEQIAMIETPEEYEAFISKAPQQVRDRYNFPPSWDEGGKHFKETFYTERLLNMETRRNLLKARTDAALKAKNAKDRDKLPTPALEALAWKDLKGDPEFAALKDSEIEVLTSRIVTKARSLQEVEEKLTYDDAYKMAKSIVIQESTVREVDEAIDWPVFGKVGEDTITRRLATPKANKTVTVDGKSYEIIGHGADGRIKIKDSDTGKEGWYDPNG